MIRKVLLSVGIISLLIVLVAWWIIKSSPDNNCLDSDHVRMEGVPSTAFWKGSCQEGHWFNIQNFNSAYNSYRIAVYNDWNGELVIDADFVLEDSCNKINSKKDLMSLILGYEPDSKILLKTSPCDLHAKLPAYSGRDAKINQAEE